MLSLRENQSFFIRDVARLVLFAYEHPNVALTAGDFWAHDGHMPHSLHYDRLAADLNLFVKEPHDSQEGMFVWRYIKDEHPVWDVLGAKWKSYDTQNRWGGDFRKKDYNHFSRAVDNRA